MRTYSGKQINRAGELLAQENPLSNDPSGYEQAMEILSYWRSCHEGPLNQAVELLSASAQKFDHKAVVAKRLKRTPSIVGKLCRFSGMKLKNMQDIGGCRAILSNEKRVQKLVRELKQKMNFRIKDYISDPKSDGYRSIHLVGDFSNGHGSAMPIEIQVRTHAQHSWATAVEIIDLFTGQAIKANRGSGDWRNFFLSASDQLALIEDITLYNQISQSKLVEELLNRYEDRRDIMKHKAITSSAATLYRLGEKLGILDRFSAFAVSLKAVDDHLTSTSAGYALLEIDTIRNQISASTYENEQFHVAADAYLTAEKKAAISKGVVVALVSADAVGGIREAYPNYFADSSLFTRYISASIVGYRTYNPTAIGRLAKRVFG